MAKEKNQSPTLVKWIVGIIGGVIVLMGLALFIRLVIVPAQQKTSQRTSYTKQAPSSYINTQPPAPEVITLRPGQTIRVKVGQKYEFDCHNGEFSFSLLYRGQRVKTGFFKPGKRLYTGNIPVDGIEFHQDPRYPYEDATILLTNY